LRTRKLPQLYGNLHGNRHRTRHLLNQEFMQALLLHFRQHGKKAIEKVAREQPAAYLKVLALLVPREHKVEHSNVIKSLSDQELEAMIEYLKTSLEAQAGSPVKVIEGMIEPTTVPATALPVLEPPKRKPNRLMMEVDTARSGRRSASRGSACRRPLAPDLTMSGRDKWRFAGIGRGSARRARFDRRRAYTPFSNGQLRLPSRSRPINRGRQSAGIFPHRDAEIICSTAPAALVR